MRLAGELTQMCKCLRAGKSCSASDLETFKSVLSCQFLMNDYAPNTLFLTGNAIRHTSVQMLEPQTLMLQEMLPFATYGGQVFVVGIVMGHKGRSFQSFWPAEHLSRVVARSSTIAQSKILNIRGPHNF